MSKLWNDETGGFQKSCSLFSFRVVHWFVPHKKNWFHNRYHLNFWIFIIHNIENLNSVWLGTAFLWGVDASISDIVIGVSKCDLGWYSVFVRASNSSYRRRYTHSTFAVISLIMKAYLGEQLSGGIPVRAIAYSCISTHGHTTQLDL